MAVFAREITHPVELIEFGDNPPTLHIKRMNVIEATNFEATTADILKEWREYLAEKARVEAEGLEFEGEHVTIPAAWYKFVADSVAPFVQNISGLYYDEKETDPVVWSTVPEKLGTTHANFLIDMNPTMIAAMANFFLLSGHVVGGLKESEKKPSTAASEKD